uniref:C-type lectin domain-containing protein n=1 Tax=Poecilia latipinna TaxID=48699 RepID=A0A3B3TRU7_9TELE
HCLTVIFSVLLLTSWLFYYHPYPAGVYVLSTNLFREYHYVSSPKTWAEAQRYCREAYADLATVDSPEENGRLLLELQGSGQFAWIGLYDNTTGWKWTTGDDDFVDNNSFPPWEPNQPDNYGGKQSCIVMNLIGGWKTTDCSRKFRNLKNLPGSGFLRHGELEVGNGRRRF